MSNPSRPSTSRRPQNQGQITADQERQARGLPPLGPGQGTSSISSTSASRGPRPETFQEIQRANELERILNNWEELAVRGMARGESIPQATLRYQKMQWGIEDDEEEEWEEETGVKWGDLESEENAAGENDDGGRSAAGSRASGGSASTGKERERKSGSGSAKKGKFEKSGRERRRDDDDEDEDEGGTREGTFGRLRREVEGERRRSGR